MVLARCRRLGKRCLRRYSVVAETKSGARQGKRTMNQADVFSILKTTMTLALELSMPLLAVGLVVGVVVSLFQAITQINDSTLSMVPKILAVFACVGVLGPWMFQQLMQFAIHMFTHPVGPQ